ncbi:MAG: hypothetical protein JXR76_16495 [Deltaproteobacteria bacterium]|nr:hypothetical protein [Deltaproteobacteria bacterium]
MKNHGTAQSDRFNSALEANHFFNDELTIEELVTMGAMLSKQIAFYNLQNEPDGTWYRLFQKNPLALAAEILSLKTEVIEQQFYEHIETFHFVQAAFVIYDTAYQMNDWLLRFGYFSDSDDNGLHNKLRHIISERLAPHIQNLQTFFSQIAPIDSNRRFDDDHPEDKSVDFSSFSPLWFTQKLQDEVELEFLSADFEPRPAAHQQMRTMLMTAFHALVAECNSLKPPCRELFNRDMECGKQEPALALFVTFIRLLQKIKHNRGSFLKRHLDYYYKDLLQFKPKPMEPERIYAVFEPAAPNTLVHVPPSARFEGGTDRNGDAIQYTSRSKIAVSDAEIRSLRMILFDRDDLISPERELGYIAGIRERQVETSAFADMTDEKNYYPVFCSGRTEDGIQSGYDAHVGFVVSSPALLLKEGNRQIKISILFRQKDNIDKEMAACCDELLSAAQTIQTWRNALGRFLQIYLFFYDGELSQETVTQIRSRVLQLAAPNSSDIEIIDTMLRLSRKALFHRYLKNIFVISFTSETGWQAIPAYNICPLFESTSGNNARGMRISWMLDSKNKPLVPMTTETSADKPFAHIPSVKLLLNPHADFFGYSLFAGLELSQATVHVAVRGHRQIVAYNQQGRLDPGAPFQPFGPMPECNNYLVIGSAEVARKKVESIRLQIGWTGLPKAHGGFHAHYQGYDEPCFDNQFVVDTTLLRGGSWQPEKPESRIRHCLFETGPKQTLSNTSELTLSQVMDFSPYPLKALDEYYQFKGSTSWDGFLKLTLTGPPHAFGHRDYPNILSGALTKNAKQKKQVPLPNTPYTPTIGDISISYEASDMVFTTNTSAQRESISAAEEKGVYLIHPFGWERVHTGEADESNGIVPLYKTNGNLFIGINASDLSGRLTMHFSLREDATHRTPPPRGIPYWFYLASNKWHRLSARHLLFDTTNGLLESGIVEIEIPQEINRDNTIFPGELFWFCIGINDQINEFGSLYRVATHAVELERIADGDSNGKEQVTAKGCLLTPIPSIPNIGKIVAVGTSYSGNRAETSKKLVTRVSERLSHRMRATSPGDIELLVMEKFPEIAIVKCFASGDMEAESLSPGEICLAVVPHRSESSSASNFMPCADAGLLARIRDYIHEKSSPFAKVQVRNPAYEQLLVRCIVVVSSHMGTGECIARLQESIVNYISPWHSAGNTNKFGWRISTEHLASYIRQTPWATHVSALSILGVTRTGQRTFHLGDTAAIPIPLSLQNIMAQPSMDGHNIVHLGDITAGKDITPLKPWSIAVPFENHLIEITEQPQNTPPLPGGISILETGKTFIVGESRYDGQTK